MNGLNGVMVGNPPYGERLGEVEEAEEITQELGRIMKNYPSWSVYMFSSLENFEKLYGTKSNEKKKIIQWIYSN